MLVPDALEVIKYHVLCSPQNSESRMRFMQDWRFVFFLLVLLWQPGARKALFLPLCCSELTTCKCGLLSLPTSTLSHLHFRVRSLLSGYDCVSHFLNLYFLRGSLDPHAEIAGHVWMLAEYSTYKQANIEKLFSCFFMARAFWLVIWFKGWLNGSPKIVK